MVEMILLLNEFSAWFIASPGPTGQSNTYNGISAMLSPPACP